ncbi:putative archaeal flagellar protein I homolog (flaI) [Nitrosotalea devaniterrae]|uniref:Putative archaeal flagellar protein I homolog (FlaI) n=1 Tax=Nitrosotalea devaniterrae TaxID=1078905 RepID=A0A128A336_9ARCH|nr:putative archaeal flagellar protein I homolog (flaI) [Candidatus Nitrosotalea devanaterra]
MVLSLSLVSDKKFSEALKKSAHLLNYLSTYVERGNPIPLFTEKLEGEHKKLKDPNLIYPISENTYIHINPHSNSADGYVEYAVIEPDEPDRALMESADKLFALHAGTMNPPIELTERFNMIDQYLDKTIMSTNAAIDYSKMDIFKAKNLAVFDKDIPSLKYHFLRKRAGMGLLDPFLTDPHLEDISIVGAGNMYVIHKMFGALKCPVFLSVEEIDDLIVSMAEQFGKTVSHAKPVIDATLPEGSRINIVFGKDISRKGTNATIRRFASTPLSITQIIPSKSLLSIEAAYLWMMLAEGMSVFVNGETASGKTTTMMAITAFIPSNWKIVTIEDTPELTLPHANWISEVTRDTGNANSSVTMFDLLKAALRQRPNYIFVGEIRGAEANIAFGAMQTGHPVVSSFHAANMTALIQRLTNPPMNIPKTNVENLNIAMFQAAVTGPDGKRVRRVLSINEVIGYNQEGNNVMFIPVFNWDPGSDTVKFRGKGSSALFISKVLEKRGMSRKDEGLLYEELALRTKILDKMIEKKIFNFYDVYDSISRCREIGLEQFMKELNAL